jgi:citrate synthase
MSYLKAKFAAKAASVFQQYKELVKTYGDVVVDTVTVSQVAGGMRDITSLLTETSLLDAQEGIRFRGYSIPELRQLLPKAPNCDEPLPEGLFLLMLLDEIPTEQEVNDLSREWASRSEIPAHVFDVIETLPIDTHPMTQFSIAIMALQTDSVFARRYAEGMPKDQYWDATYEDAMNLIAKLPRLAAYIYRRSFHQSQHIAPDPNLDWAANFAQMLGYESADFKSLMRLYLTLHADHEGGNASAHTCILVGSTLADAYQSFAAAMNALAGPLHGLANQEVVKWIREMLKKLDTNTPTTEQIADYIRETLAQKRVVPGYGHAVLRQTDPRFKAQMEFCQKHFPDDEFVNVIWKVYETAPKILGEKGNIKNPFPNVDAHSGATLLHYGMGEFTFYTVLFGVSRALGVLAWLIWSRALGLPLERPKSETIASLQAIAEKVKAEKVSAN